MKRAESSATTKRLPKLFRRAKGQGMTEYIVIVALIALAGIVATRGFGHAIDFAFAGMAHELGGNHTEAKTQRDKASSAAAKEAEGAAGKKQSLKDYGDE